MTDEIVLTLPAEEDFREIAHLVLGGLGTRIDLTLELMDDLQIALDALLALRDDPEELNVSISVEPDVLRTSVGPFPDGVLDQLEGEARPLGLRRVLETVCDTVEVDRRNGSAWVELTKRLSR